MRFGRTQQLVEMAVDHLDHQPDALIMVASPTLGEGAGIINRVADLLGDRVARKSKSALTTTSDGRVIVVSSAGSPRGYSVDVLLAHYAVADDVLLAAIPCEARRA